MKHERVLSRQKSAKVNKSRQESAEVDKNKQKSAQIDTNSAQVGRSRHYSIALGAVCRERRQIIGDGHTYWNIKGCGDAARFFTGNSLFYREKACVDFCWKCGTNVPPLGMEAMYGDSWRW